MFHWAIIPLCLLTATPLSEVTVGVSTFAPCVIRNGANRQEASFHGFDIDIINAIADFKHIKVNFVEMPFQQLRDKVSSGEIDLAVAGITITREREESFDFSYPYLESDIRMLSNAKDVSGLGYTLKSFFSSDIPKAFVLFFAFIAVTGLILWWADYGNPEIPNDPRGIIEAMWCSFATGTTVGYGDVSPKKIISRIMCVIIFMVGTIVTAHVISIVSLEKMNKSVELEISDTTALRESKVGTVVDSTSEDYLKSLGISPIIFESTQKAIEALRIRRIEVVVYDSPSLLYEAKDNTEREAVKASPVLIAQSYGIAFPTNSPLKEVFNQGILEIRENGIYDKIYWRWFGK